MSYSLTIQRSNKSLIFELLIVGVLFLLVRELLASFKYASQVAELVALTIITFQLRSSDSSWKDLGLRKPQNWFKAIGLFVLCVATIGLTFNFIIAPLFPDGANDINGGQVISTGERIFQLIVIGIGTAAIGEELLFRGYLLNRLNQLIGPGFVGTIIAILVQAVIFGLLHSGIQGMISAGVIGLILGGFYVASGRNLWVVIAAHAVPDILSFAQSIN